MSNHEPTIISIPVGQPYTIQQQFPVQLVTRAPHIVSESARNAIAEALAANPIPDNADVLDLSIVINYARFVETDAE